ncbi:MAG: 3-hydroxyacyl-CoA dehydrogenase [Gammaproteobacteria bacterium]|nr:3-hydroxyacyl-CoA dehydrogenase [Gammaproteobacteria bacterium]
MNDKALATSAAISGHVAVVGAGAMGRGIALVAASAGHTVLLFDAIAGTADKARTQLGRDLDRLVERGRITVDEARARLARIVPAAGLDDLRDVSLVIEAVVEDMSIKRDLFQQLESLVAPDAVLATNTSSLSITGLACELRYPGRFAGMHFFNPAPVLPLVEIVHGASTDRSVIAQLQATAVAWGKTPVVCGSSPGFIVNRVARPFYGEAMRALEEGAATPATIDALMRESGGFRMGPFELTDLIGQDVNYSVTESVYKAFHEDPRYRPCAVQQELVLAGHLGRKSGRGFYQYGDAAPAPEIDTAPAAPMPVRLQVFGRLGPAQPLVAMAGAAGVVVTCHDGPGHMDIDGLKLCLSDGRLATERAATEGPVALLDLALDYTNASRLGLAFADQVPDTMRATAIGLLQGMNKQVCIVDDVPGMVVMRTVAMLINEAVDAVYRKVANEADIETAMLRGVNYPLGLLDWLQRIGANHVLTVVQNLDRIHGDGRYRASPLLRRKAALASAHQ